MEMRARAEALTPQFKEILREVFEERITFNRLMGLRVLELGTERARCGVKMRPDLYGNYMHQRLHGGVIGSMLDATGGLVALAALAARHAHEAPEEQIARFSKLGTIDLRVDYLRPATGTHFEARAELLRLGSRVANVRMEFHDADDRLVSVGTGSYIIA